MLMMMMMMLMMKMTMIMMMMMSEQHPKSFLEVLHSAPWIYTNLYVLSSINFKFVQKGKNEGLKSFQANGTWTGVVGDLVTGEVEFF